MKRLLMLVFLSLLLTGCGEKLVHNDFKADLDQVLGKLDTAYEENRTLDENEEKLIRQFEKKYIAGKFLVNDEWYEMTDIEKEIVSEIDGLDFFTEHEEPLASESTIYERVRGNIDELLKAKSVPEEIVGKHPIYEEQEGMHPVFEMDTKKVINTIDNMIGSLNIDESGINELKEYVDKYLGAGFEVDGTHYLHSDETDDIYLAILSVYKDVEEGTLRGYTEERYIEMKERLNQK